MKVENFGKENTQEHKCAVKDTSTEALDRDLNDVKEKEI